MRRIELCSGYSAFLRYEERVFSDKFLEFIPMNLFVVEGRDSSIGVANGSKLEIDVYGEVVGSQTWEGVPFTSGS